MEICIADHGGFFGEIFDLAVADNLEVAAMPSVDCCFCTGEGIGLFLGELGTKKFCVTRQELQISLIDVSLILFLDFVTFESRDVTFESRDCEHLTYLDLDLRAKSHLESPFAPFL